MSSELVNWISIIGSFLSLIGVIIALVQISKTRRAAEAARMASLETQKIISRNLSLSDVSVCVKYIEEVRLYLKNESYELAQIRVSDLVSQITQIQEILKNSNQIHQIDFEEMLSELTKTRNIFRKKLEGISIKINNIRVNNQLDIVSNSLNKLIGRNKIDIEKGA